MDKAVEAARKELQDRGCDTFAICTGSPCECMQRAITAADEARAVTDEDVARALLLTPEMAEDFTRDLHAAGFKVIRG